MNHPQATRPASLTSRLAALAAALLLTACGGGGDDEEEPNAQLPEACRVNLHACK